MIEPPWTDEQVTALNEYQTKGYMHPFTCPNRSDGKHYYDSGQLGLLLATGKGWICPDCDYMQQWAHDFMADGSCTKTPSWMRPHGEEESH